MTPDLLDKVAGIDEDLFYTTPIQGLKHVVDDGYINQG